MEADTDAPRGSPEQRGTRSASISKGADAMMCLLEREIARATATLREELECYKCLHGDLTASCAKKDASEQTDNDSSLNPAPPGIEAETSPEKLVQTMSQQTSSQIYKDMQDEAVEAVAIERVTREAELQTDPVAKQPDTTNIREELASVTSNQDELLRHNQHLLEDIGTVRGEAASGRNDLARAVAVALFLDQQLSGAQVKLKSTTQERDFLLKQVSALQEDVRASAAKVTAAEEAAQSTHAEASRWQSGFKLIFVKKCTLQSEKTELLKDIGLLREEIRIANERLAQAEKVAQEHREQVSRWKSGVKSLIARKSTLEAENADCTRHISTLEEDVRSAHDKLQEREKVVQDLQEELTRWQAGFKSIALQRAALEQEKVNHLDQIANLQEDLRLANDNLRQAGAAAEMATLSDFQSRLAALQEERDAAVTCIMVLRGEISSTKQELDQAKSSMTTLSTETLQATLDHSSVLEAKGKENEELLKRADALQETLTATQDKLVRAERLAGNRQGHVTRWEADYKTVVSQKFALERDTSDLSHLVGSLKEELRVANERAQAAEFMVSQQTKELNVKIATALHAANQTQTQLRAQLEASQAALGRCILVIKELSTSLAKVGLVVQEHHTLKFTTEAKRQLEDLLNAMDTKESTVEPSSLLTFLRQSVVPELQSYAEAKELQGELQGELDEVKNSLAVLSTRHMDLRKQHDDFKARAEKAQNISMRLRWQLGQVYRDIDERVPSREPGSLQIADGHSNPEETKVNGVGSQAHSNGPRQTGRNGMTVSVCLPTPAASRASTNKLKTATSTKTTAGEMTSVTGAGLSSVSARMVREASSAKPSSSQTTTSTSSISSRKGKEPAKSSSSSSSPSKRSKVGGWEREQQLVENMRARKKRASSPDKPSSSQTQPTKRRKTVPARRKDGIIEIQSDSEPENRRKRGKNKETGDIIVLDD